MVMLGLGCIGIGRKWGVVETAIPSEEDVFKFLQGAYDLGIRFFDTAPAYGSSEERLGKWLQQLSAEQLQSLTISTKVGEFWNFETHKPYRVYEYNNLVKSIDRSFQLLPKIDILLIHGFTSEVMNNHFDDIKRAFEYAKSKGIKRCGVSLSDELIAERAIKESSIEVIQLPHNILMPYKTSILQSIQNADKLLVVNRPFGMGKVALDGGLEAKLQAYKFILMEVKQGIVLTGTKSLDHLRENIELFNKAKENKN